MQEPFDNIQKLWALKDIIDSATVKYQEIAADENSISKESIDCLINTISDSANKIIHMRWTDQNGLQIGTDTYIKIINNL